MQPIPHHLLSDNARIGRTGSLSVAGCDVAALAAEFGTPLFIYDEDHLRARCREAIEAFPGGAAYATKAFLCTEMARVAVEEGMDLDVSTGGEVHIALAAGAPPGKLVFHGNNKAPAEIETALGAGVRRVVADSPIELDRLERASRAADSMPQVMVRVNPGIEAHTHEYLRTGATDSKFGIPIAGGEAEAAVRRIRSSDRMTFAGIHAHVGSQVFDVDSFRRAIRALASFIEPLDVPSLSIGGGLGVAYVTGEEAPSITEWGAAIAEAASTAGVTAPISAEPGRAIVASSALTVYTVGVVKHIPSTRTYVAVDGGMSDNPRPVLYGSGYEVFMPARTDAERDLEIRLVGKHCESGDILVRTGHVPSSVAPGDLLATPVTGAYGHSMGSNYNMVLRPPVVFVRDGEARLVVRRETHADLLTRDVAGPRG